MSLFFDGLGGRGRQVRVLHTTLNPHVEDLGYINVAFQITGYTEPIGYKGESGW